MNTTNWAQYYTGEPQSNHTVTVVGYDDNYPKENFTRIAEGEVVEGSTPPADGAFIVKNSWGALTEDDKATVTYNENGEAVYQNPNAASWGFEDTGYFYLSYYDNSILAAEFEMPESFQPEACDINGDGSITISDVTEIQRYLADFDNIYRIGEIIFYDEYELPFIPE